MARITRMKTVWRHSSSVLSVPSVVKFGCFVRQNRAAVFLVLSGVGPSLSGQGRCAAKRLMNHRVGGRPMLRRFVVIGGLLALFFAPLPGLGAGEKSPPAK